MATYFERLDEPQKEREESVRSHGFGILAEIFNNISIRVLQNYH